MKTTLSFVCLLLAWTLMPGLGGCVDRRHATEDHSNTQPRPLSTRPASTDRTVQEDVVAEEAEPRHPMTAQFDRQVHNRELADMSLSDVHFLPHRPILNSNGTQRLNHLAWLVDRYGGKINLDLEEPKSELAQARMQTVCRYLKACGLAQNKIQVAFGLPESRGLEAREAVTIYRDSQYQEQDKNKSAGSDKKTGAAKSNSFN
jgi:hypothetical protein